MDHNLFISSVVYPYIYNVWIILENIYNAFMYNRQFWFNI